MLLCKFFPIFYFIFLRLSKNKNQVVDKYFLKRYKIK